MGIDKLLGKLQKHLDKGKKRDATVRCDRIDSLLQKLGKKKKKIKKKLANETVKSKQKELGLELRIVSLELKKGIKRRKELKDRCKESSGTA